MVSATVRAESERPLTVEPVNDWQPGGEAVDFRAAVKRGRYLWAVKVKLISRDRQRVFVKFENDGCTGWVPVDELREG